MASGSTTPRLSPWADIEIRVCIAVAAGIPATWAIHWVVGLAANVAFWFFLVNYAIKRYRDRIFDYYAAMLERAVNESIARLRTASPPDASSSYPDAPREQ